MTPPRRRFLFCITGVGAGNTTRNLAILNELQTHGPCEIRLAAQGRARELMEPHYPTEGLSEVTYSNTGDFRPLDIIRQNLDFPARFLDNERRMERLMREFRPDLVLADSDFYCLRPARRLGLRQVALNNAAIVVETIRRGGNLPPSCRFSYNVIERTDYWLQRRYPRRVLCPTVRRLPGLHPKFVQIPPMVRPEITPMREPGAEVVVLTGGSGLDTKHIDLRAVRSVPVRTIGSPLALAPPGATQLGFTLDVISHFRKARVLVVQGGFSSISEAVALRIPTVAIPIANHAEQWSNGMMLESLGLGISTTPGRAGEAVNRILADYDRYWQAAQRVRVRTDGHRLAAGLIWKWADPSARL